MIMFGLFDTFNLKCQVLLRQEPEEFEYFENAIVKLFNVRLAHVVPQTSAVDSSPCIQQQPK